MISATSSRAALYPNNRHSSKLNQIFQLYASNVPSQKDMGNRNASEVYVFTDVREPRDRLPSFLPQDGDVNMVDAKHAEKDKSDKKTKHQLYRWLAFIFVMAWIRIFLFNYV